MIANKNAGTTGKCCVGAPKQQKRRILLVDDEPRELFAIADVLEHAGFDVVRACNSYEAQQAASNVSARFDVVIADIALPDENGIELHRNVCRNSGVDVPVLFISAHSGAEILRFYGIPVTDNHFLEKPFSAKDLIDRVNRLAS